MWWHRPKFDYGTHAHYNKPKTNIKVCIILPLDVMLKCAKFHVNFTNLARTSTAISVLLIFIYSLERGYPEPLPIPPWFLPCNTMHKRSLCWRPVVCLSVTLVDCIQTAEDIVKLLSRPSSPVILVFWLRRRYPIPRGTISVGAQNTRGGKILQFSTKITIYLGNGIRQGHGCYGTLIGSRMHSIEWWHFQWP